MAAPARYHHGDLRAALSTSGIQRILDGVAVLIERPAAEAEPPGVAP